MSQRATEQESEITYAQFKALANSIPKSCLDGATGWLGVLVQ